MNQLEEIEFDLYSDSIDFKLIQADFNRGSPMGTARTPLDPYTGSSKGGERVTETDQLSDQLESKTLQLLLKKESESAIRSASILGTFIQNIVFYFRVFSLFGSILGWPIR